MDQQPAEKLASQQALPSSLPAPCLEPAPETVTALGTIGSWAEKLGEAPRARRRISRDWVVPLLLLAIASWATWRALPLPWPRDALALLPLLLVTVFYMWRAIAWKARATALTLWQARWCDSLLAVAQDAANATNSLRANLRGLAVEYPAIAGAVEFQQIERDLPRIDHLLELAQWPSRARPAS